MSKKYISADIKRWLAVVLAIVLVVIVFIFTYQHFYGNKDRPVLEMLDYNLNKEKKITHITSGVIKADTLLAIRFQEEQVGTDDIGKVLNGHNIFTFEPVIKGKVYWGDRSTIVFEPEEPLLQPDRYIGVLDLEELFPVIEGVRPSSRIFEFETLGQQIVQLKGEFVTIKDSTDDSSKDDIDKTVRFSGELKLNEKAGPEQVQEAVRFFNDNYNIDLKVIAKDDYNFRLESEKIVRNEKKQEFTLSIAKEGMNFPEDFTRKFILSKIGTLAVKYIEEERQDDSSLLKVVFTDELDPSLDYKGFVMLEPEVDFRVSIDGKVMTIDGDFQPGQKYKLKLFSGIKSRHDKKMEMTKNYEVEIKISNIYPAIEYSSSGIFLTSAREKRIAFRTMNLARVQIKVKKVEEENLIKFFEENSYYPRKHNYNDYSRYGFKRVGDVIDSRILKIGNRKNSWIQSEIDLSKVIEKNKSGLYIIQLEFDEDDALYFPQDWNRWQISNYVRSNGQQAKHIISSDLGITATRGLDKIHVLVTDILTAEPVQKVRVILKDKQNNILETAYTDNNGMCEFDNNGEYLEVRKRYQYSILKFNETGLSHSVFEVGGVDNSTGIKTFAYTDRGVYRPGDKINLSVIARNEDNTFPVNHPVTLKLFNPRNKLVYEETSQKGRDGFYSFTVTTEPTAPSGNWKADLIIGDSKFYQTIRVENVVPYRIKLNIDTEKEVLTVNDNKVNVNIFSEYLFGAPGAGLESNTVLNIEPYQISFKKYKGFTFSNESIDFKTQKSPEFNEKLNDNGKAKISWQFPEIKNVPSALRLRIESRVIEKGGRQVPKTKIIPIKYYDRYVGIKQLDTGDLEMGNKAKFDIILVNDEGELVPGQELKYRIYHLRRYWWWEYDSRDAFRRHYKTDEQTELIKEGIITSTDGIVSLEHKLTDYGEMLIEIEDPDGGHRAGYFFRSYWWGGNETSESADVINIRSDRKQYYPGDKARIIAKTPQNGRALVTVEKLGKVMEKRWIKLNSTNTEVEIPIREEYVPNAYVTITVFQPYTQTTNDLPVRMYGIVPLMVQRRDAKLDFSIETPENVKPGEEFEVRIKGVLNKNKGELANGSNQDKIDGSPQFTIAIVDEGLLAITNFATPDPYQYFFQKERLLSSYHDTLSDIIGFNQGYIYNVFSVGGGMQEVQDYRLKQLQSQKTRRFEPVSLYHGPIELNDNGEARVGFTMPEDYIGQARVMVVGADGGRYGSKEEHITVKSPLMVMPTLPRVLGVGDKIQLPVTVFAMEDGLGRVEVNVECGGPVVVDGKSKKEITFTGQENKDIYFGLKATQEVGQANIRITARSGDYLARKTVDLDVRPYNPYTYKSEEKVIESESNVLFKVPEEGIKNTTSARISISPRKNLNLNHRLQWLIRYPYGCIEQTISSVFPQLYLNQLYKLTPEKMKEIDKNINETIKRLHQFQLKSGGFSYWPEGNTVNHWGTNYAGHFLLEAKEQGYYVPPALLDGWKRFQLEQTKDNSSHYLIRSYRLYLLAQAGEKGLNAMNYLRESKLDEMGNTARYYLAAAYLLRGYKDIGRDILAEIDTEVEEYQEIGPTYGSALRDKAIMLQVLALFEDHDKCLPLYNEIVEKLSEDDWYSTQSTAYSLLALSKYLNSISTMTRELSGSIIFDDNSKINYKIDDEIVDIIPLASNYGQQLKIINDSEIPLYATLEWEGIPLRDHIKEEEKNMSLKVEWLDQEGKEVDPAELEQGTTIYGVYTVDKKYEKAINEVALVQVLPSGWEIENMRLLDTKLPEWMKNFRLNNEDYVDIRDDRIMWFFDFKRYEGDYNFVVKINAVTVGEFYLPPVVVEAMYNNNYKAVKNGMKVKVEPRNQK